MEVEIIRLDNEGRGICYVNNIITFVSNALPKEVVKIKLIKQTKKYNIGKVLKYLKTSPERQSHFCPYYGKCGGCDLEHLTYEKSCEFKKTNLETILKKYAMIDKEITFIKSSNPMYYRNKITLNINNKRKGFYEEQTHNVVDINYCYLATKAINKIIPYLNMPSGQVVIRSNYNAEIIIDITSSSYKPIDIASLTKENKIVGIIVNNKIIYGEDHFIEIVNNKLFQVHSKSFFQINLDIASQVIPLLKKEVTKEDVVLDLYCGVGFLGLSIASEINKLYGVEVSKSAVMDALLNMKINKITNAKYFLNKSEDILTNLPDDINTVIVDPPRSGLKEEVINYLITNQNIQKVIYMSCNPFTLARDLQKLKTSYTITKIYGLDMFCYTKHLECLCILKNIVKKTELKCKFSKIKKNQVIE